MKTIMFPLLLCDNKENHNKFTFMPQESHQDTNRKLVYLNIEEGCNNHKHKPYFTVHITCILQSSKGFARLCNSFTISKTFKKNIACKSFS